MTKVSEWLREAAKEPLSGGAAPMTPASMVTVAEHIERYERAFRDLRASVNRALTALDPMIDAPSLTKVREARLILKAAVQDDANGREG